MDVSKPPFRQRLPHATLTNRFLQGFQIFPATLCDTRVVFTRRVVCGVALGRIDTEKVGSKNIVVQGVSQLLEYRRTVPSNRIHLFLVFTST